MRVFGCCATRLGASWLLAVLPVPVRAQSLAAGVELYQQRAYPQAATALFATMQRTDSRDERERAQVYLAETLRQKELYIAALSNYANVLKSGQKGAYFLNAVEGILAVQEALHDPLLGPQILARALEGRSSADFSQLDAGRSVQLDYLLGAERLRQHQNAEAQAALERVPDGSPQHARAAYLLGVLAVRADNGARAQDLFQVALADLEGHDAADDVRARNLTLLALGRVLYGLKQFDQAEAMYARVPRFSDAWFAALSEGGWTHFQQHQYGRVLGDVQSLISPFFAKRHRPEAYMLAATTYFANCQWDRVRLIVDRYKREYESLTRQLDEYLVAPREVTDYVRDVTRVDGGAFGGSVTLASLRSTGRAGLPEVIARRVRDSRRFHDLYYVLRHLRWERDELARTSAWAGTRLGEELRTGLTQYQDKIEPALGGWVRTQLVNEQVTLKNLSGQMNIIDFEVSDAERRWLESGREILKGRRARLPRPEIPSDVWQHWSFAREAWKDELGYYQFAIRTECE